MILEELHNIHWRVLAICDSKGRSIIDKLVSGLSGDLLVDGQKLDSDLDKLSEHGPRIFPPERCHQISSKEQIYQLTSKRLRLFWFYDAGKMIICAHGFIKKSQKTPMDELAQAVAARNRYVADKDNGRLQVK